MMMMMIFLTTHLAHIAWLLQIFDFNFHLRLCVNGDPSWAGHGLT